MNRHITKKHDHEKGKLREKALNPDYQERFREEGKRFNRGGTASPRLVTFRGNRTIVDMRPFVKDDRACLVRTLERNCKFVLDGHVGSVCQLLKIEEIAEEVRERFEMTKKSILQAQEVTRFAIHPKTSREFGVVPFKCFLTPAVPLPEPFFKEVLAFSAVFPCPAP